MSAGTPDEMIGKNDLDLFPEETARRFMQDDQTVLEKGGPLSFEGVATSKAGTQAYLVTKDVVRDTAGTILGIYGISHDITELRTAQETLEQTRAALFRSQKMEAVGQLTGGIAHDFNNILMVIMGNLELLKFRTHDNEGNELIDETLRATRHGQDLTANLLAFSRKRQLNPQPVALNALVDNIVRLLGRTLGAHIRINTATSRDAGIAMVDPAALEGAIVNIALNARDAMPDGGTLTVRTSKTEITEPARNEDDLAPGPYAMLALQDTGAGMPPEVITRAFEPFFTTKSSGTGDGTGLGLSMVYGFAKQSGGGVTVASEVGRGTTVILYLPLTKSEPDTTTPKPMAVKQSSRSRLVLVVEDEAAVRGTLRRQVEMLGHAVTVADSVPAALAILQSANPPDVLLTDVVLGSGLNGIDLVEQARKDRPTLPVVFVSGYTAVPEAQARINATGAPMLPKPCALSQLERALNSAIAKPRM